MKMKGLIYIILFTNTYFCLGQSDMLLHKIFLDINYTEDIRTLYNNIEKNKNFTLITKREHFLQGAEFYAKYNDTSNIYYGADSLILHVWICNNMNTFFKIGAKNCNEIIVQYYFKDNFLIETNYQRMDSIIKSAIILNNPDWKNQKGATDGAYFLSETDYPYITLSKNRYKKYFLSIGYTDYDK